MRAAFRVAQQRGAGRAGVCRAGAPRSFSFSDAVGEHEAFLADAAQVTPCRHLPALLALLRLQGLEAVAPTARRTLHPHVVPLARVPGSGEVMALLRLPFASKGDMLPLVRTAGPTALTLVAPGAQQYLHRCAAEADEGVGGGGTAQREATLQCVNSCGPVYQAGDVAKHTPKLALEKYLAVKVGVFPDIYEGIAQAHLERGDATAALIAAERSTKLQVRAPAGRACESCWRERAARVSVSVLRDSHRHACSMGGVDHTCCRAGCTSTSGGRKRRATRRGWRS